MPRWTLSNKERFEAKIEPITETGCWIWNGSFNKRIGYGSFWLYVKKIRAHRASWIIYNGPIPGNLHVLHYCDTTSCVNPRHLFLGTHSDNMKDMHKKGRGADFRGEKDSQSKLTTDEVIKIRQDGRHPSEIAKDYKIHPGYVYAIKNRTYWKHI